MAVQNMHWEQEFAYSQFAHSADKYRPRRVAVVYSSPSVAMLYFLFTFATKGNKALGTVLPKIGT